MNKTIMTELTASSISDMVVQPAESRAHVVVVGSRLPSLDGWRAISILLVLGAHTMHTAGFPPEQTGLFQRAFDGHLGVRFFFVISGLLITWLMLAEEQRTGTVDLKNFYLRRALRILPVYLAFLGVLALLQIFTPFQQSSLAWLGNLTFTTNYINDSHSSNHLWSLAVEEQFYLFWPAMFVYLRPQARWGLSAGILAAAVALAFFNRIAWSHPFTDSSLVRGLFHEWSFFNNADSLAIGCATAFVMSRKPQVARSLVLKRPITVMLGGLLLVSLPALLHGVTFLPLLLQKACWALDFICGRTLQSLGFALLMLQSIHAPHWGLYRLLNGVVLTQIGILSYSIYIWQQFFCTKPQVFGLPDAWWISYPLWIVPALLVAALSYYGLERPLLVLRHRFR